MFIYQNRMNFFQTKQILYKMSIEKGNDSAMLNYGFMLFNGNEVEVNKKESFRIYKMAADKGNSTLCFI